MQNKMSFIGISIGDTASFVAVSKDGNSNIVANAGGDRCTPAYVSVIGPGEYSTGIEAKNGMVRNASNTLLQFHSLLAKKYDDSDVQALITQLSTMRFVRKDGVVAYEIDVDDSTLVLLPVTAIVQLLSALKATAEDASHTSATSIALAVPFDYTPEQRSAILGAANKAGFSKVELIEEGVAAALAHNIGQDTASCHNGTVLIYDAGAHKTRITILAVRNGMFYPVHRYMDTSFSGSQLDEAVVDHLAAEFKKQTKMDVTEQRRPMMKLRAAAEKAKHVLSTQPNANISIESLADGRDFSISLNRSRFDILNSELLGSCTQPIVDALAQCGLTTSDIQLVLLAGGTSNVAKVKANIAKLFAPETVIDTISPEEVFAVGAARHAAQVFSEEPREAVGPVPSVPFDIQLRLPGGNKTVVEKYTALPLRTQCSIATSTDGQTSVQISLIEKRTATESVDIAELSLVGLPEKPAGEITVRLMIFIDATGSLKLKASEDLSGVSAQVEG